MSNERLMVELTLVSNLMFPNDQTLVDRGLLEKEAKGRQLIPETTEERNYRKFFQVKTGGFS